MPKYLLLLAMLYYYTASYSQTAFISPQEINNPCPMCLELIEGGLEEELNIRKGEYFNQDLKAFFSSDKFLEEYKNGKWQGDVGIIVDGVPIDFGFGKSDEEVKKIQEKIRSATSMQTTSQFYETYRKVTKNVALAQVYLDCLIKVCRDADDIGFQSLGSHTEKTATFIFTYRDRGGRPATVNRFEIKSAGRSIRATNAYRSRDRLLPEKKITCVRNPNEDLVMTISTTAGDETITIESDGSLYSTYNQLPVGTIITSYLDFDQFNVVTNNNSKNPYKLWSDLYSYWSPCDGRNIENSTFSRVANLKEKITPDLRGVFLRGLNTFDKNEKTSVNEGRADPKKPRSVGEFQYDALQNHKHKDEGHKHPYTDSFAYGTVSDAATGRDVSASPTTRNLNTELSFADISEPVKISDNSENIRTDTETRPKNVSVFYYIKIN